MLDNLQYKPLSHATWIMNAVIPVSEHFQLSVSYGNGLWYVGTKERPEVAIQAIDKSINQYADLVKVSKHNDNIYHNCGPAMIECLFDTASKLKFGGRIEVFDIAEGQKTPQWNFRFFYALGNDYDEKIEYAKHIWGSDEYRVIPK